MCTILCALCVAAVPVQAATGGPDEFGYVYRDTAEADGPVFDNQDIAVDANAVEIELGDDEMSPATNIGFTFNYYGVDYTQVYISSNGFLTFLNFQSVGCCAGKPMPQTGTPDAVVAAWWGDLNPGEWKNGTADTSGGIHVLTEGTAPDRVFTVQYKDIEHFDGGPPATFKIKLFENTNVIEMHYTQAATDGQNHTIGIEDPDGEIGLLYYRDVFPLPVTEAVRFSALADLEITKADDPDPIVAGAPGVLTYTLTITNLGPDPALDIAVNDVLPDEVDFFAANPTQGVCLPAGQEVNCELGQIDALASAVIEIEAIVAPDAAGGLPSITVTNSTSLGSNATDVNPSNDSASEDTEIVSSADLTVVKEGLPESIVAGSGEILTYTVEFINNGPSDSIELTLTDVLPPEVDAVSVTPGGPDCMVSPLVDETVSCGFSLLPAGQSTIVTIEVTAGPEVVGTITNTVLVGSTVTPDPDSANDMTTAVNTVIAEADLSLVKSDSPDPVAAGDNLTYTIDIATAGPSYAYDVTVTDTIPDGTTLVSATPTQGACSGDPTVSCELGTLTEVGAASIDIEVLVDPSWTDELSNTATVATTSVDPVPGNDSDTETTTVIVVGDLEITKTNNERYLLPGDTVVYDIVVRNNGPSDIIEANVLDLFPDELISVTWTCFPAEGVLCNPEADSLAPIDDLLTVPAGLSALYVATGTVDPATTSDEVANTATVTEPSGSTDPVPGNNESTDTDPIREEVFLDGFESGDTSAWSNTVPLGAEAIRWTHALDPDRLADAARRDEPLVEYYSHGKPALRVAVERAVGGYRLLVSLRDAQGGWHVQETGVDRDAAPRFDLVWWASPERDARAGGLEVSIDGTPRIQLGGLDNFSDRLTTSKAVPEVDDE